MRIHIDALEISCIIGLLDFEREAEQKILLHIEIDYAYRGGGFLDYSKIVGNIEQHLKEKRYLLLEEALLGIKTLLFVRFPVIEMLSIKLSKPDILPQCSVGLSGKWANTPQ